jgi:tripartite-type tricarboxylate transporter receptor subunit TctC
MKLATTIALAACAAFTLAAAASAQDKIDKPVHIIVGFPPGGTADIMARAVADKMKDSLGQPVIVENRPGAIGRIAADAVKAAPPDGSMIMVMPIGPMAVVPHTYKTLSYDPIKDFAPIGMGSTFQFAIAAGPMSGARTWPEYVAWAKANPGKSAYATSGAGSLPHFFGLLLARESGIEMLHVPYKGSAAYMNELIGGNVPTAVDAIADLTEQHRAGKIRILASSGAARSTAVPDVPTFTELGIKGGEAEGWFGFFAPAKTPKAIVDQLNRSLNQALQSPEIAERLTKLGLDPKTTTPEEFGRILAADYAKWGPVVKASGFTAE